jgi:hypothetical protein
LNAFANVTRHWNNRLALPLQSPGFVRFEAAKRTHRGASIP